MNTQMTEDYCDFETAKLLKEKGFDWDWSPFYSEQDKDEWDKNNNYNIPNPNYDATIPFDSEILNVVAPHVSLQMAMKWLRKVHKLYINVCPSVEGYYWTEKWHSYVENLKKRYPFGKFIGTFNSPEDACEAAIRHSLTNLI